MIRTMFVVETKVTCKNSETEWSLLVAYNADTIGTSRSGTRRLLERSG